MKSICLGTALLIATEEHEVAGAKDGGCDNRLPQRMHESKTGRKHKPDTRHQTSADADNVLLGIGFHDKVCAQQTNQQAESIAQRECTLWQPPQDGSRCNAKGKRNFALCYLVLESISQKLEKYKVRKLKSNRVKICFHILTP